VCEKKFGTGTAPLEIESERMSARHGPTGRIVSGKTSHAVEHEDGGERRGGRGGGRGCPAYGRIGEGGSRFSLQAQRRAGGRTDGRARARACMRGDVTEPRRGERIKRPAAERASARKKCSSSGIVDSLES